MKIGRQIAKLQTDTSAREVFRRRLHQRREEELPCFTTPNRGLKHNRLIETLNLHTPRLALEKLEERKSEKQHHARQVSPPSRLPNPSARPIAISLLPLTRCMPGVQRLCCLLLIMLTVAWCALNHRCTIERRHTVSRKSAPAGRRRKKKKQKLSPF